MSPENTRPVALARGVLGNLATFAVEGRIVERLGIARDDLAKRVMRLAGDERMHDGDLIYADAQRVIALHVLPDDVLVCRPESIARACAVAHALGNRHLPMQIDGDAIVVRADRLVEDLFVELGVPYACESRTLAAPFRHANAPHSHA